jgi:hypothetical protein
MSEPDYPIYPNPGANTHNVNYRESLRDAIYALRGYGGFVVNRVYEDITLRPVVDHADTFDVTNTVQVLFPIELFKGKLGDFNDTSDSFESDNIRVDVNEFKTRLVHPTQVISVGSLTQSFKNFGEHVKRYFGFESGNNPNGGFETLFKGDENFENNVDNFNQQAFIDILDGKGDDGTTKPYSTVLEGYIDLPNVTSLLRDAVNRNIFGNRTPSPENTADGYNWGVNDNFQDGDLIVVPDGIVITLKVAIDNEQYYPTNNIGPILAPSDTTTASTLTEITRIIKADLLIRMHTFEKDVSGNNIYNLDDPVYDN